MSKLDRYPIPKVEDLFANLSGGRTFTKIDLKSGIPANTAGGRISEIRGYKYPPHKGLFNYTRLPFGVSSAPGIFQRVMEGLLQGNTKDTAKVYFEKYLCKLRFRYGVWS